MPLIKLSDIEKTYRWGKQELQVLRGISMEIVEGEFVAIMGPSGSGKSTLMNIIGCLDNPSAGSYQLDGSEIANQSPSALARIRLKSIGFVFQNFHLLPRLTALQNVALPLMYSHETKRVHAGVDLLERVGLKERMHHRPKQLSGGEMQRVAIARALMNDPKVILADEPTGNLDSRSGIEIMKIFRDLHAQGRTIVMVTHDDDLASTADRIIHIRDGVLVDA